MSDITNHTLEVIITAKRQEIRSLKIAQTHNSFSKLFANKERMVLIAELKRKSPSAGELYTQKVETLIDDYVLSGVDAISVVTDRHFFGCKPDDFLRVRKSTSLPILRKDFILDTMQILQAYESGANAVLLIARIVDDETLERLVNYSRSLGVVPVVEICNTSEISKILKTKATFIAVNVRDLDTFKLDHARAQKVIRELPSSYKKLLFSGVSSSKDIENARNLGVDAVLIGTSLLVSSDRKKLIKNYRSEL